jgi:hypothetical protein
VSASKGDRVDVAEFEACWHAHVRRVTAYAERHVGRDASYDVASATISARPVGARASTSGCACWTQQQLDPDGPAVVYGEFRGVRARVATVRVSGQDWVRTFGVSDDAFAGEVPAGAEGDRIRFDYLDARGVRIATAHRGVVIESE